MSVIHKHTTVPLAWVPLKDPREEALDAVRSAGVVTVTRLAEAMNVKRATAGQLLAQLVESGVVETCRSRVNGRSCNLYRVKEVPNAKAKGVVPVRGVRVGHGVDRRASGR